VERELQVVDRGLVEEFVRRRDPVPVE
jgi:hypothetical protein